MAENGIDRWGNQWVAFRETQPVGGEQTHLSSRSQLFLVIQDGLCPSSQSFPVELPNKKALQVLRDTSFLKLPKDFGKALS